MRTPIVNETKVFNTFLILYGCAFGGIRRNPILWRGACESHQRMGQASHMDPHAQNQALFPL